jgi:uncharacterized protein involved in response to NO
MAAIPRTRPWSGPALLSYGFRPFFLLAGVQGVLVMLLWTAFLGGALPLPAAIPPAAWHAHELLFGYGLAVVAGFLLTAIPNWTGRLPLNGLPLLCLVGLWLVGRLAVLLADLLPAAFLASATLLFPAALAFVAGREVVAGDNRRNLPVVGLVAALGLAQAATHLELALGGDARLAPRLAVALLLLLIMLIGGRIVPSFTTNWLRHHRPGTAPPAPFDRFDRAAIAVGALGLLPWVAAAVAAPPAPAGLLAVVAGLVHLVRLWRWRPLATGGEPLLWVLHLAYLFVPLGFLAAGAGLVHDLPGLAAAATHLWTVGAVGLMTLAVMTRATRGHTGRALTAPAGTVAIYGLVVLAAALRVAAALLPEAGSWLLPAAGLAWIAAFAGFLVAYGPMLLGPRVTG